MKILEGVSGFEMGLNIQDASLSKSASLYVQKLNTVHGDGPCEVYGQVAGVESEEKSLSRDSNLAVLLSDAYAIACTGLLAPSGLAVQAYCMPELIHTKSIVQKASRFYFQVDPCFIMNFFHFLPKPTCSSLLLTLKFTTNHAEILCICCYLYT